MNDQEKSVLLAKAISGELNTYLFWLLDMKDSLVLQGVTNITFDDYVFDLYDPANMVLAKKAILWGYTFIPAFQKWLHKDGCALAVLVGAGGYGLALDRLVLELKIEGAVEERGAEQDYPVPGTHTA